MTASRFLRRLVLALVLSAAAITPAYAADAPTVHLLAIGDSRDAGFGKKLEEDARHIVRTFEERFAKAGRTQQLRTALMLGKDVSANDVTAKIGQLKLAPADTLVVLYSGHGGTDPKTRKHYLTFTDGSRLARADLLGTMKARNVRLAVLLTDCCSGYGKNCGVRGRPVVPTYQPHPLPKGAAMEWATVDSLFLKHAGVVDITAAEPGFCGEIDKAKAGSLFTNALVRVLKVPYKHLVKELDRDRDGFVQWDEFLPELRAVGSQYMRAQNVDGRQEAYATALGNWQPAPQAAGR
jgi:Caspase domain